MMIRGLTKIAKHMKVTEERIIQWKYCGVLPVLKVRHDYAAPAALLDLWHQCAVDLQHQQKPISTDLVKPSYRAKLDRAMKEACLELWQIVSSNPTKTRLARAQKLIDSAECGSNSAITGE